MGNGRPTNHDVRSGFDTVDNAKKILKEHLEKVRLLIDKVLYRREWTAELETTLVSAVLELGTDRENFNDYLSKSKIENDLCSKLVFFTYAGQVLASVALLLVRSDIAVNNKQNWARAVTTFDAAAAEKVEDLIVEASNYLDEIRDRSKFKKAKAGLHLLLVHLRGGSPDSTDSVYKLRYEDYEFRLSAIGSSFREMCTAERQEKLVLQTSDLDLLGDDAGGMKLLHKYLLDAGPNGHHYQTSSGTLFYSASYALVKVEAICGTRALYCQKWQLIRSKVHILRACAYLAHSRATKRHGESDKQDTRQVQRFLLDLGVIRITDADSLLVDSRTLAWHDRTWLRFNPEIRLGALDVLPDHDTTGVSALIERVKSRIERAKGEVF